MLIIRETKNIIIYYNNKKHYWIKVITKMKIYGKSVEINHNQSWPYIPDHPYRILTTGESGSGKSNLLLNLIKHQRPDIDKRYLYVKDPFESLQQLLITGRQKVASENLKNPKACINYSQKIDDTSKQQNCVICFIESPLKMMRNVFHFLFKAPFISFSNLLKPLD